MVNFFGKRPLVTDGTAMKKILYYASEEHGSNHTSVEALFNKYLKRYFDIDIVFKGDKTEKDRQNNIVISRKKKRSIWNEVRSVSDKEYDLIIVRNDFNVLKNVIEQKEKNNHSAKIGFQCTFLHAFRRVLQALKLRKSVLRKTIEYLAASKREQFLLQKVDFILPNSRQMNHVVNKFDIPYEFIYSSIDMDLIPESVKNTESADIRFIYVGTVDKLRELYVVFKAFSKIKSGNWKFDVYTRNIDEAHNCRNLMEDNQEKVTIHDAIPREDLYRVMSGYDVGISLIPISDLYNVASPIKLSEYFACKLAVLTTPIPEAVDLYVNADAAIFSGFDEESITQKIEEVIGLGRERLSEMGVNGYKVVNEKRNYEKNSVYLREFLDSF